MKSKVKLKNIIILLIISIAISGTISFLYYLPQKYDIIGISKTLRKIEDFSLSLRFSTIAQSRSELVSGTMRSKELSGIYRKMTLIKFDNSSLNKFGTIKLSYDDWEKILSYLNSKEEEAIKLIWLDVLFSEKNVTASIIKEIKNGKRLGQSFFLEKFYSPKDISKNMLNYDSEIARALKPFELNIKNDINIPAYQMIITGNSEIFKNFNLMGCGNFEIENDISKKVPLIFKVEYYTIENGKVRITNVYYPSSTLTIVTKILDSSLTNIMIEKGKIVIKNATYNGKVIDFAIPVDKYYRLMVTYRGTHKSGFLREISLKDITRAGLPRDSILLIGVDIEGLTENQWSSPVGNLPSTEHLAYSIGTIVNKDFMYESPPLINIIYLFLISIVVAFLLGRKIQYTILASVTALLVPTALGFGSFMFKVVIPFLTPVIASVLTLISGQIYLLLTEEKEKRFIRTTFSKYLSPEFVNILIQNPELARTGGEEREVTMLFSDIRSFTTLSEGMTPKELVDFLNLYLSRMTDIILANKGTLDKYIGDAIVAFWGVPVEIENHAYYACYSAVKMIKALNEFNKEMEAMGKTKINIGIGLNSGKVIVGNIGSEKKRNYTAIGDTATLAEELQDENKTYNTNIIISEFTYNQVKDLVIVRELDKIYIKESKTPIKIYELIDVKE